MAVLPFSHSLVPVVSRNSVLFAVDLHHSAWNPACNGITKSTERDTADCSDETGKDILDMGADTRE